MEIRAACAGKLAKRTAETLLAVETEWKMFSAPSFFGTKYHQITNNKHVDAVSTISHTFQWIKSPRSLARAHFQPVDITLASVFETLELNMWDQWLRSSAFAEVFLSTTSTSSESEWTVVTKLFTKFPFDFTKSRLCFSTRDLEIVSEQFLFLYRSRFRSNA